MEDCIFCKIVEGDVSTELHYASEDVVAFSDIAPIAPVHVLIVPRKHIASMNDIEQKHSNVIAEMFFAAKELAAEKKVAESGYKLLVRTGIDGGQEVPHIHLHLIGGATLSEDIHPV